MTDNGNNNSIVYQHCERYYNALVEDATVEELHGVNVMIFRGSVVRVFRGLGISQSYYSRIRKSLIDMGCITVLQQGSRAVNSILVLHRAPTWEDWKNVSTGGLTAALDVAILAQRVDDVAKLIGGINVRSAIADLSLQIEGIRREVERIGKTPSAKRKY